jgi:hypothetical protein
MISDKVQEQLIERICKSQNYSLQVDENTDFANQSHLLCYVRYEFQEKNYWRFIVLPLFDTHHCWRGVQQFEWISDVKWNSVVQMCSDQHRWGASGRLTGLIQRIRENSPSVTWHQCWIRHEVLATNNMPEELEKVLNESIKIINFIKSRSLNSRLFEQCCQSKDSDNQ